jgi:hypothetical protein
MENSIQGRRTARCLIPAEILAVLAIAGVWAVRDTMIPAVVPLLAAASISRWIRGRSWSEVWGGGADRFGIGVLVGLGGMVLALALGTPLVESATDRAVEWASFPMVRGSGSQLFAVLLVVVVSAVAAELALRGWIVERVLERGGSAVQAVAAGALAEALIAPGGFGVRLGAALVGVGLGGMFVAGDRRITAPLAARLAFAVAAVVLESAMLIG